jgi:hypothetical protein
LIDDSLTPLESTEPTISYEAMNLPTGATFDATTAMFEWTPDFDDSGESAYQVQFRATDDGDTIGIPLVSEITVPIIVTNANRRPVVSAIENQVVQRDATLPVTIAATDEDGNPLQLSATDARPGFDIPDFATFTDNGDGTGQLVFAPGRGDRGDYSITVRATDDGDGGGEKAELTGEFTFVVSVDSPNEEPEMAHVGNRVAVVGQLFQVPIRVSDLDEDNLTYSVTGLPAAATITAGAVYGTATLNWTPTAGDLGARNVTIVVTDSGNGNAAIKASDQEQFTITVRSSNAAPVLSPIGNKTVTEQSPLSVQLLAADLDGDPLTYSAENLPLGANFNPITGLLTWTPTLFQAGIYTNIRLGVTDGAATSSELIRIEVQNLNQPPIIVPILPQAARERYSASFQDCPRERTSLPTAPNCSGLPVLNKPADIQFVSESPILAD